MTEALSQNLENGLDIAFDMLTAASTTTATNQTEVEEPAFSNLINTISANIEQAQSDFDELAAQEVTLKSNLSSINKLALNTKEESSINKDVSFEKEVEVEEPKTELKTEPKTELETGIETETEAEIEAENQDFSFAAIKTQETNKSESQLNQEKKDDKEYKNALISSFEVLNQNGDLDEIKTFIENDFNIDSIESLDELEGAIDNVLSLLDKTNLSDEQKTKISETFSKLKKTVDYAKNTFNEQNEPVLNEAKKTLESMVLKDNSAAAINASELEAIVKQPETVLSDDSFSGVTKEAQEVLIKTVDAIYNNDSDYLKDAPQELEEAIDNLQKAMAKNENADEEVIEFNEKMLSALKVANEKLSDDNLETISEDIKLNLDKNNTTKVLELLGELKENPSLTKEEKAQIETAVKQINDSKTDATRAVVDIFKKEIDKNEFKFVEAEGEKLPVSDNIKTIVSKANNLESEDIEVDKDLNKDALAEDVLVEKTSDSIETKISGDKNQKETPDGFKSDTKSNAKADIKGDTGDNTSFKTDNFIEAIADEVVVDVKFSKIPPSSGALSVTDEVAKIAMNEHNFSINNNLNTPSIKQAPSLKFDLETSDVLNQFGNKLTQLNNSQGHKMTLVLRPNDLGRVSIELKSDSSGLTTHIVAQNSEVRSYIENNIHTLRQNLVEAGVNVNNISIKTAGETDFSNYEGLNNSSSEQQQQQQGQQEEQRQQKNQKELQEELKNFSNYDLAFSRDFSSVLTKTLNYSLN